jgi:hypothetical protein
MTKSLVGVAAAALLACGGSTTGPPLPESGSPSQVASTFFQISYPPVEAPAVQAVAAAADAGAPGIIAELGATGMPQVRVTYYASQAAMADAVRPVVGQIPAFATGLVTSARDIHIVGSAAATPDAIARKATVLLHEFAHCVSMHRNPSIPNNPRWLWETIAVYAARDRSTTRLQTILAGAQPTFAQLNSFDNTIVYDAAFSLGEFIVERGGLEALRTLLMSNGDTQTALALSPDEFLSTWFTWARSR